MERYTIEVREQAVPFLHEAAEAKGVSVEEEIGRLVQRTYEKRADDDWVHEVIAMTRPGAEINFQPGALMNEKSRSGTMIFVDTKVFSELTRDSPEDRVVNWLFEHRNETLMSTLVIAELAIGIRTTPGPDKRALLARTLDRIVESHVDRVIPFDLAAARRWGEMGGTVIVTGGRSGMIDSMLAAQALVMGVPVATRNVRDFEDTGVTLIDPWQA